MTPDFYDLLYNGYTGEYQLMSSLYRNGLDAVRPPADMGIDVVSLNLKDQLENPRPRTRDVLLPGQDRRLLNREERRPPRRARHRHLQAQAKRG